MVNGWHQPEKSKAIKTGTYPDGKPFQLIIDISLTEELLQETVANDVAAGINKARRLAGLEVGDFSDVFISMPYNVCPSKWWYDRAVDVFRESIIEDTKTKLLVNTHGVVYDSMSEYPLGKPFDEKFYVHVEKSKEWID